MVIKVYISGVSASQEVKKRQQRVLLILDSAKVEYEPVDITEPGKEEERQWVQQTCKERSNPYPPQFFNGDLYCGDYDDFNSAVDINKLLSFLKLDHEMEADALLEETPQKEIEIGNAINNNNKDQNKSEEEIPTAESNTAFAGEVGLDDCDVSEIKVNGEKQKDEQNDSLEDEEEEDD